MTESKLKTLVTEAVQLDRKIEELTERLKTLKAALVTEAEGRGEEHVQTDGGGASWTADGVDGCVARVTFPARKLKSKIDSEGKAFEKIRAAAGRFFDKLFRAAVVYRPVDNFRQEAETMLERGAPKLINLVQTESAPQVAFETKEKRD